MLGGGRTSRTSFRPCVATLISNGLLAPAFREYCRFKDMPAWGAPHKPKSSYHAGSSACQVSMCSPITRRQAEACPTTPKYRADPLSRLKRFWYPRGSAQQTEFLFFRADDRGRPGIFGAGAIDAGPGCAGPACATNFGSGSAANASGASTTNSNADDSFKKILGCCHS